MTKWLAIQKAYQEVTYGVDFEDMWRERTADELTRYVTMNLNAAFLELAEAQQETPWKPWVTIDKQLAWRANGERFAGELVDVMFFIANALLAAGVTDEWLAEHYAAKMAVNQRRQVEAYDGVSTKCPTCKRALDEPGQVLYTHDVVVYCSQSCAPEGVTA